MINISLEYIYILFSYTKAFYEIYEKKKKMLYLQFVKLKYLIHETVLKIHYRAFSSLLVFNHFQVPYTLVSCDSRVCRKR